MNSHLLKKNSLRTTYSGVIVILQKYLTIYSLRLIINSFIFILLIFTQKVYSQKNYLKDKLSGQDSSAVYNKKICVNLNFGPSITTNPGGIDLLIFGPTLSCIYINCKYRLLKIETSFHSGISIFENFSQYAQELNFKTGKIKASSKFTTEFYYGIGLIMGRKRDGIISSSGTSSSSGFVLNLSITEYKKKDFIFIGLPLEYKIQWSFLGLGVNANLNPYLPYIGAKWYLRIGNKYKKLKS